MKVLLIISDINYSGAPKMLVWLANKLVEDGKEVNITTIYNSTRDHEQSISSKIKCSCLKIKKNRFWIVRNGIQMLHIFTKLLKLLRSNRCDVVIWFGDSQGIPLLIIKKILKIKVIVSERGDPYAKESLMDSFRRRLYRFTDGIVFQTNGAKNFFKGNEFIIKKSTVIPNPVVNKEIPNKYRGERDNVIVSVGRLYLIQKRQDILIDAFELIENLYPGLKLVIYGDGPDRNRLIEIIEKKGLSNKVKLPGPTKTIYKSISKAKVFVLSSDFEGIPNALIEAMSIGLPVISTDCSPGGARLLIDNYENGIIVPRGDVGRLANALIYILDNPEIADVMGDNALHIIDKYNEDRIYKIWKEFIEIVVSE